MPRKRCLNANTQIFKRVTISSFSKSFISRWFFAELFVCFATKLDNNLIYLFTCWCLGKGNIAHPSKLGTE